MKSDSAPRVRYGAVFLLISVLSGCMGKFHDKEPNRAEIRRLTEAAIQANRVVYEDEQNPHVDGEKAFAHRKTLALDVDAVDLTIAPTLRLKDANTPLRVRGGAMGFRSDYPWISDGSGYCTAIATIKRVELIGVPNASGNPNYIALTSPWTVTLAARNYDASANSNAGITVSYPSTACGGMGILITPIQNGMSPVSSGNTHYGFYKRDSGFDTLGEGGPPAGLHRARFQNNTGQCSKDEDACEHMSSITAGGHTYNCSNGECEVQFHP